MPTRPTSVADLTIASRPRNDSWPSWGRSTSDTAGTDTVPPDALYCCDAGVHVPTSGASQVGAVLKGSKRSRVICGGRVRSWTLSNSPRELSEPKPSNPLLRPYWTPSIVRGPNVYDSSAPLTLTVT